MGHRAGNTMAIRDESPYLVLMGRGFVRADWRLVGMYDCLVPTDYTYLPSTIVSRTIVNRLFRLHISISWIVPIRTSLGPLVPFESKVVQRWKKAKRTTPKTCAGRHDKCKRRIPRRGIEPRASPQYQSPKPRYPVKQAAITSAKEISLDTGSNHGPQDEV